MSSQSCSSDWVRWTWELGRGIRWLRSVLAGVKLNRGTGESDILSFEYSATLVLGDDALLGCCFLEGRLWKSWGQTSCVIIIEWRRMFNVCELSNIMASVFLYFCECAKLSMTECLLVCNLRTTRFVVSISADLFFLKMIQNLRQLMVSSRPMISSIFSDVTPLLMWFQHFN